MDSYRLIKNSLEDKTIIKTKKQTEPLINRNVLKINPFTSSKIAEIEAQILARKKQFISAGFSELDFSFPEISNTFDEMSDTINKQLFAIVEILKKKLTTDPLLLEHQNHFKLALQTVKKQLIHVINEITILQKGKFICPKSNIHSIKEATLIAYPYGESIHLCAKYAEISDVLYRTIQRFQKFGPNRPFYEEALLHAKSSVRPTISPYLNILEQQDYITSFNKVISTCKGTDEYKQFMLAKENNYTFTERTYLLRKVYKQMHIPFHFHSVRYKFHLAEDLLKLNVVLFPTMKVLAIKDFLNFRSSHFFPLGISPTVTYADGYKLTAADFFYHDVKHSLDMMSRNFIAYFEQENTEMKGVQCQQQVKRMLDVQIVDELSSMEKQKRIELKKAIDVVLFEMCHEEAYPYDYNALIRSLEKPNPFYGERLVDFLKKKLTILNFFFPEDAPVPKEVNFPVALLDSAREIILKILYQLRQAAFKEGYKSDHKGHWEITRGQYQLNPYRKLEGEKDYEKRHKQINNIYFIFNNKEELKEETSSTKLPTPK